MDTAPLVPLHVDYVAEDAEAVADALEFVFDVLSDPLHAALVGATGLVALLVVAAYVRVRPFRADLGALRAALLDYRDLLPWLLRISLGMPLVGAGFAGYYFSPAVHVQARLLFVALGFLLLFGLATRFAAAVGVIAFLAALPAHPRLLLAGEFVGGLLAVVLLGSGRPSADHVLQQVATTPGTAYGRFDPVQDVARWFQDRVTPYRPLLPALVRATLGLQFVFLGVVEKLLNPGAGIAVVEKYGLTRVVPVDAGLWVVGAGLAEVAVGLALLVGVLTRAVAGVAFLLFTLTLFALPDDPVLAHLSLYGLVSVLIVTGGGPHSLDVRLRSAGAGEEREDERGVSATTDP